MLILKEENAFKKDVRLMQRRSKNIRKLQEIVCKLSLEEKLPAKNRNHQLIGKYTGLFECHIEPDWLLIYRITEDSLILVRTGTHSDLFK